MQSWRDFRISNAALVAIVALCISIGLLCFATFDEEIKTNGIETIEFKLPKIVSRFDLDEAIDQVPGAASKVEEAASRVVEEVSSKATAISDALSRIPTKVTLGMDQVCWGPSQTECTPIWKGLDDWFPAPLEQFMKKGDRPWPLVFIKMNIIRSSTTLSLAFLLLVLLYWVYWLRWEYKHKKTTAERNKDTTRDRKRIPPRYVILLVIWGFVMILLLSNLVVLFYIHKVLGFINIQGITTTVGELPKVLVGSFVVNIIFLIFFWYSRVQEAIKGY